RIPDQHATPIAFAAIAAALEPTPADTRLDDGGLRRRRADMMCRERPPGPVLLREHVEGAHLTRLDSDLLAHQQPRGLGHVVLTGVAFRSGFSSCRAPSARGD